MVSAPAIAKKLVDALSAEGAQLPQHFSVRTEAGQTVHVIVMPAAVATAAPQLSVPRVSDSRVRSSMPVSTPPEEELA